MKPENWVSVSLPKDLVERVDAIVKKKLYGYTSISEFIKDAVRRRLENLENRRIAENRRNGNGSFVDVDGDVEVFEGGEK